MSCVCVCTSMMDNDIQRVLRLYRGLVQQLQSRMKETHGLRPSGENFRSAVALQSIRLQVAALKESVKEAGKWFLSDNEVVHCLLRDYDMTVVLLFLLIFSF